MSPEQGRSGRCEVAEIDRRRPRGTGERSGLSRQLRIDDEYLIHDRDLNRSKSERVVTGGNEANNDTLCPDGDNFAGWSRKGVCGTRSSPVGVFVGNAI